MVHRAVSIHATAVRQLSVAAFRDSEEVDAPSWLRRPNAFTPRSVFLEQTVISLAGHGNAYWLIDRDAQGRVTNLTVLDPMAVEIDADHFGRPRKYMAFGKDYTPADIRHLALFRVPGKAKGLGPIQAARQEIQGAIDTRDYSSKWFQDSGVPTGVLKSDQVLSPEDAKAAKAAWTESQGAKRGVAVLGNGLSYSAIYLTPADAQFLESRQFDTTQIARLFGVPASLMLAGVAGSSQTYANVEQDWLGYVRFSLMQYLTEIEDAFSELLPGRREARFNIEALLRADTTTRYAAHAVALSAGFLTLDEVREIEDRPMLPNAPEVAPNDA